MGGLCLKSPDQVANVVVGKQLRLDHQTEQKSLKILLLGAGESGKSTFFKQMILLYGKKDFSTEERERCKKSISVVVYVDILTLLKRAKKNLNVDASKACDRLMNSYSRKNPPQFDKEGALLYSKVWEDKAVQHLWSNRSNLQVQDALEFFMENLDRLAEPSWVPSNDDMLRARVKTSGLNATNFQVENSHFEMYDVGGQRSERKKWIHYFEGITCVLFVAAISEFDQVLYEKEDKNRQEEALELFNRIVEHETTFRNTPIVVFLNKKDLFREKLTRVPFKTADRNQDFDDDYVLDLSKEYNYKDEGEDAEFEHGYTGALDYLVKLYESAAPARRGNEGQIYFYATNSLDQNNIRRIFSVCKDVILARQFQGWS